MACCDRWFRSVVCQSTTRLRCAKITEWIEVLFGVETLGTKAHCIRWDPHSLYGEGCSMRPLPNYFGLLFVCCQKLQYNHRDCLSRITTIVTDYPPMPWQQCFQATIGLARTSMIWLLTHAVQWPQSMCVMLNRFLLQYRFVLDNNFGSLK